MENFIVSARKYRPTTFDSVVGQMSITSTLKNAIKSNHLAQAFLFCGPRGVGKTTCARILAKTINCFSVTENIEACNECDSCKAFDENHSLNILELDGASNNSVEDIRNLIDQVRFAPQIGTHKVYIIDEVHMLSQAAFNAFLKTLEEPPKHAIFILATTEKHKIIPTILSRCQIFDFNRIQIEDIANHLVKIASKENVEAEPDGLHIIAQKADGALRDALSMFDQIVSFSGGNITYKTVIENLNILDYDYYFKVTDYILSKNVSDSLLVFNDILNHGFNGHNFVIGLAEHFRNLLVCQDEKTVSLLEVGANIKERYITQAASTNVAELIKFLDILNEVDTKYKASKNHRLLVEVMLMQLCSLGGNTGEKKNSIINIPLKSSSNQASKPKIEPNSIPKEPIKTEYKILEQEPLTVNEIAAETTQENQYSGEVNKETEGVETEIQSTQSTPIVEEKKSPLINTSISFADSISISTNGNGSLKTEVESETLSEDIEERPTEEFTMESFEMEWNNFKKLLLEDGKSSLASIFERIPEVKNNTIELLVENKVLHDEFKAQQADFLEFIRKALSNFDIQINIEINKDVASKKAYTPQEKFIKMSEKNPTLKTLVQKLDMDVGYA